jgi:hypothetical protein
LFAAREKSAQDGLDSPGVKEVEEDGASVVASTSNDADSTPRADTDDSKDSNTNAETDTCTTGLDSKDSKTMPVDATKDPDNKENMADVDNKENMADVDNKDNMADVDNKDNLADVDNKDNMANVDNKENMADTDNKENMADGITGVQVDLEKVETQEIVQDSNTAPEPQAAVQDSDATPESHTDVHDSGTTSETQGTAGELETDADVEHPAGELESKDDDSKQESSEVAPTFQINYRHDLMTSLIGVFARKTQPRIITIDATCKLIEELVWFPGSLPCLHTTHLTQLDNELKRHASLLLGFLHSEQTLQVCLELFEDEVRAMERDYSSMNSLLSHSMHLLPILDHASPGVPFKFRQPNNLDGVQYSIKAYLRLRKLLFKLNKIAQPGFDVFRAGFFVEPDFRLEQEVDFHGRSYLRCSTVNRNKLCFLLLHSSTLILLERHPTKLRWGIVKMLHPLRHQECSMADPSVPTVLDITLRTSFKPHPSCVLAAGTVNRWRLRLFFHDAISCGSAEKFLVERATLLRGELYAALLHTLE